MRLVFVQTICLIILLTSCHYNRKITAENISLSPIYSSGSVLHTSPQTLINGYADPGGVLAVKISNYVKLVQVNDEGNWKVEFPEIIITEPFSITFEGRDTSFTIDNIRAGKIFIYAGDGNQPAFPRRQIQPVNPKSNKHFSIFIPDSKAQHLPQETYTAGQWYSLNEAIDQHKTSLLFPFLHQLIPDSKVPVGIIDLSWPGSHVESWIPDSEQTQDNEQHINVSFFDSIFTCNQKVYSQMLAMNDTCVQGIKAGVTRKWYNDEYWKQTELPVILGKKNDYPKKRIAYLRKKIYISSNYLTSDFTIHLHYIHGNAQFYFNEKKIEPHKNSSNNTLLIIPDTLMQVWTNILTIRLFCPDSLSGFYGDEFICHNSDSSYYRSINTEWKYSFNMEPDFPDPYPLEVVPGLAYNLFLHPSTNIDADAIIFQFRNSTLYQTLQANTKVCSMLNRLPESWNKTLACTPLTKPDSIIYRIDTIKSDSIIQGIKDSCQIEIVRLKQNTPQ